MVSGSGNIELEAQGSSGKIEDSKILTSVMGSDHCPVELDIKIDILSEGWIIVLQKKNKKKLLIMLLFVF